MKYIVTINNNNYEVEVEQGEAWVAKTYEKPAAPMVEQVVANAASAAKTQVDEAAIHATAGEIIASPMPGIVLDIIKSAGDRVKKGDTLLILEAMKMENEVMAPKDGIIARIAALKGAAVNTGDVLVVLQ